MYVCGPTVYDLCHIGNARSVVVFDVVVRYLRQAGYEVTYVRNFTDVDDKIIERAQTLKTSPKSLAKKYIDAFYSDMDALKVKRATLEPRATEYISQMRRYIERLIKKDMAYVVDGDVYFAVDQFADYGKLSGRRIDDMEAGARVDIDHRKRNPFDFALWKSTKPDEPSWESPWGEGRPGWHIECSAMSSELLGETFDIHGGGKDLIFPHHENEIAQSEGATGQTFARYWMHNGYVNINREKMSKSLGNFMFTRDLLERYHPETIRLFLLSNQYRSPIDFSDQNLNEAETGLEKVYTLLNRLDDVLEAAPAANATEPGEYFSRFCEAMDDDFNTAKGVGIIFDGVRHANKLIDAAQGQFSSEQLSSLQTIRGDIPRMGGLLGIITETAETFLNEKRSSALAETDIDEARIEELISQRTTAREAKDWGLADQVRDTLSDMGVVIEDRPGGTMWKVVT
jgi:cysteinyl-tRNA synthetase